MVVLVQQEIHGRSSSHVTAFKGDRAVVMVSDVHVELKTRGLFPKLLSICCLKE